MTTLISILLTWYLTKIYYTRALGLKVDSLKERGLVEVRCSKCSQVIVTKEENLRTPFYCSVCK